MFSLNDWNRCTVGPKASTKPSSISVSIRLSSESRRTPLSSPEAADSPAMPTTSTIRPTRNAVVEVSQPVTMFRPAASCSAP
ncbi:hypothetical protein D3C71_1530830 [compost metagenome]